MLRLLSALCVFLCTSSVHAEIEFSRDGDDLVVNITEDIQFQIDVNIGTNIGVVFHDVYNNANYELTIYSQSGFEATYQGHRFQDKIWGTWGASAGILQPNDFYMVFLDYELTYFLPANGTLTIEAGVARIPGYFTLPFATLPQNPVTSMTPMWVGGPAVYAAGPTVNAEGAIPRDLGSPHGNCHCSCVPRRACCQVPTRRARRIQLRQWNLFQCPNTRRSSRGLEKWGNQ